MPTTRAQVARSSRRRLVASLALLACALPGCSRAPVGTTPAVAEPTLPAKTANAPAPRAPAQAAIVTVSEREGEILVELPLGSDDGLEPGTLLRVYRDVADRRTLKGMVQVTEVLDQHRAVGRQIGLSDRGAPLAAGDTARVADLAATLTDYSGELAAGEQRRSASEQAEDARFAKLRENYQRELALAQARLDQQLATAQAAHDQATRDLAERQQRELEAKDLERKADLAAVRGAMAEEARSAIARDREERGAKLRETVAENRRLSVEVDRLAGELARCQLALAKAEKDLAARDESHRLAVRAEVETRQVLIARVDDLEARLGGGAGTSPVAVLANDPARDETVLSRLNRISAELAAARAENVRLGGELAATKASLASGEERAARVDAAERLAGEAAAAQSKAEAAAASARQETADSELARLEAERTLFDLAGRVMKLDPAHPGVSTLQDRLRQLLAANVEGAGAEGAAP
jgi:hypothetical protein